MTAVPRARVLALYLPQYHPIPENDAYWGAGFTEWTNVARGRPLYRGHYQPILPTELGFYDLRLPEAWEAQAALARAHGVEGFIHWHYWFAGRKVLERPTEGWLSTGRPDLPFALGWANHSWSGRWAGKPGEVLIEQTYPGRADHEAHFDYLVPFFADRRYIRVDGKPLFLIFDPFAIPDLPLFLDAFRARAERAGLPGLHLVAMRGWGEGRDALAEGYDAQIGPNLNITHDYRASWRGRARRLVRQLMGKPRRLFDYGEQGWEYPDPAAMTARHYPSLRPNWDNTARAMRSGSPFWHAEILHDAAPDRFAAYLKQAVAMVTDRPLDRRIVLIRSWNEWAEGNTLEPCERHGRGYLAAIKRVVMQGASP